MVRPTNLGRPLAIRQGELGFDRAETDEPAEPEDLLADEEAIVETPFEPEGTFAFVQSKAGAGSTSATVSFDDPPGPGNTVYLLAQGRGPGPFTWPGGFSEIVLHENDGSGPSNMRAWAIARGLGDGTTTDYTVSIAAGTGQTLHLVGAEFAGMGMTGTVTSAAFAETDLSIAWPSPTGMASSVRALMLLMSGGDDEATSVIPGSPVAAMASHVGSIRRLDTGWRFVDPSSPPYTYATTASTGWTRGVHASIEAASPDAIWQLSPQVHDGDDATYKQVDIAADA